MLKAIRKYPLVARPLIYQSGYRYLSTSPCIYRPTGSRSPATQTAYLDSEESLYAKYDKAIKNTPSSSDKYNFQSPRNRNAEVSCTILDATGTVTAVSKRMSRTSFLAENGLHPRDLRNLSHAKVSLIPSILVRDSCILINMLELQAIIRDDKVMILHSVDSTYSPAASLFIYDLESKLGGAKNVSNSFGEEMFTAQTYEMRALESILLNTVNSLEVELQSQLKVLNELLVDLEDHVDRDALKELLIRSKAVSHFYQKCKLVREVISDLLDNDEDLIGMYLTEKKAGKHRDITDHAEVELLLEAYYKQLDEIVQQAEQVMTNVKTTEEIINIMLDANRNSLMLMELKITIGTLGFSFGMFLSALYGMNLENFIEESPYGFGSVTGVIATLTILVTWFNLRKLSVVKKVAMMGGPQKSIARKPVNTQQPQGVLRRWFYTYFYKKEVRRRTDPSRRAVSWKWLVEKDKHR
ncbi:magnesium transporter Mrs2p, mitochondrial [Trichomonascus vanleenenianus]|uniref:Mrs2p n=1 Tax=Trichomonascus vanleenenianus TaxID=2268995 RepID=UPI003ECAEF40